jgi:hypothetical protein
VVVAALTAALAVSGPAPAAAGQDGADYNGDGFDDLAIGVSSEDINGVSFAGAVNVLYGTAAGLTADGNQFWHQDRPGIKETAEAGDEFGEALAAGDFNNDGFDDLAVGVVGESVGVEDAGAVNVLYGTDGGLRAKGDQFWHQDSPGIRGRAKPEDHFGCALAAGDFGNDGFDDLAVGALGDSLAGAKGAGAVNVIYGSAEGLTTAGNQFWHQDVLGIRGRAKRHDNFGSALAAGDFDNDGFDDLAVGGSGDSLGGVKGGAVNVIYGSAAGLAVADLEEVSRASELK